MTLTVAIVGGGLVGSLTACFFAKRGWKVDVYERRQDPRLEEEVPGRSINLAMSHRARTALREVGLEGAALELAIPVKGRFVHPLKGKPFTALYGEQHQYNLSVRRMVLNEMLMSASEGQDNVSWHFNCKLLQLTRNGTLILETCRSPAFSLLLWSQVASLHGVCNIRKLLKRAPQVMSIQMSLVSFLIAAVVACGIAARSLQHQEAFEASTTGAEVEREMNRRVINAANGSDVATTHGPGPFSLDIEKTRLYSNDDSGTPSKTLGPVLDTESPTIGASDQPERPGPFSLDIEKTRLYSNDDSGTPSKTLGPVLDTESPTIGASDQPERPGPFSLDIEKTRPYPNDDSGTPLKTLGPVLDTESPTIGASEQPESVAPTGDDEDLAKEGTDQPGLLEDEFVKGYKNLSAVLARKPELQAVPVPPNTPEPDIREERLRGNFTDMVEGSGEIRLGTYDVIEPNRSRVIDNGRWYYTDHETGPGFRGTILEETLVSEMGNQSNEYINHEDWETRDNAAGSGQLDDSRNASRDKIKDDSRVRGSGYDLWTEPWLHPIRQIEELDRLGSFKAAELFRSEPDNKTTIGAVDVDAGFGSVPTEQQINQDITSTTSSSAFAAPGVSAVSSLPVLLVLLAGVGLGSVLIALAILSGRSSAADKEGGGTKILKAHKGTLTTIPQTSTTTDALSRFFDFKISLSDYSDPEHEKPFDSATKRTGYEAVPLEWPRFFASEHGISGGVDYGIQGLEVQSTTDKTESDEGEDDESESPLVVAKSTSDMNDSHEAEILKLPSASSAGRQDTAKLHVVKTPPPSPEYQEISVWASGTEGTLQDTKDALIRTQDAIKSEGRDDPQVALAVPTLEDTDSETQTWARSDTSDITTASSASSTASECSTSSGKEDLNIHRTMSGEHQIQGGITVAKSASATGKNQQSEIG